MNGAPHQSHHSHRSHQSHHSRRSRRAASTMDTWDECFQSNCARAHTHLHNTLMVNLICGTTDQTHRGCEHHRHCGLHANCTHTNTRRHSLDVNLIFPTDQTHRGCEHHRHRGLQTDLHTNTRTNRQTHKRRHTHSPEPLTYSFPQIKRTQGVSTTDMAGRMLTCTHTRTHTRTHTLLYHYPISPQIKLTQGVSTTAVVGRMLTCTHAHTHPFTINLFLLTDQTCTGREHHRHGGQHADVHTHTHAHTHSFIVILFPHRSNVQRV